MWDEMEGLFYSWEVNIILEVEIAKHKVISRFHLYLDKRSMDYLKQDLLNFNIGAMNVYEHHSSVILIVSYIWRSFGMKILIYITMATLNMNAYTKYQ